MMNSKKKNIFSPHQHRSGHSFFAMMTIAFIMCLLMFVLTAVAKNVTYASADPVLELLDVEKTEYGLSGNVGNSLSDEDPFQRSGMHTGLSGYAGELSLPGDFGNPLSVYG